MVYVQIFCTYTTAFLTDEYTKASPGIRCEECLKEGFDYCISSNTCIERATEGCAGQEDHITGDPDFASGAVNGGEHSMVCPADRGGGGYVYSDSKLERIFLTS